MLVFWGQLWVKNKNLCIIIHTEFISHNSLSIKTLSLWKHLVTDWRCCVCMHFLNNEWLRSINRFIPMLGIDLDLHNAITRSGENHHPYSLPELRGEGGRWWEFIYFCFFPPQHLALMLISPNLHTALLIKHPLIKNWPYIRAHVCKECPSCFSLSI